MLYACEECKKLYKTPEEVKQCEATHEEERLKLAAFNTQKEEKLNEITTLRNQLRELSEKIKKLEYEYVSTYEQTASNGFKWLIF